MIGKLYDEVLFKLRMPESDWITVYVNGRTDGAPSGTAIINRAPLILHSLQARQALDLPAPHNPQRQKI